MDLEEQGQDMVIY